MKYEDEDWYYNHVPGDYPCASTEITQEMYALRDSMVETWGSIYSIDEDFFYNWLDANTENIGGENNYHSYVTTDLAMYHIEIDVDKVANGWLEIAITIRAYDKRYATSNGTAARLVRACREAEQHTVYPGWLSDIAFARAVCAEMLSHAGDAPAIQEQLRKSISRLDQFLDIKD